MKESDPFLKRFLSIVSKKRIMPITFAVLVGLQAILPKESHAVSGRTFNSFKQAVTLVDGIISESKQVSMNGRVYYELTDKSEEEISKIMNKVMKQLEKDAKEEMESEDWGKAQHDLEVLARVANSMGLKEYSKRIWSLIQDVHADLRTHVDYSSPGLYTLKGSGKVYAIGLTRPSRIVSISRKKAEMNAISHLFSFLGVKTADLTLFRPMGYGRTAKDYVGVLAEFQGDVIVRSLEGQQSYSAKDVAKKLEAEGRFLPLN